MTGPEVQPAMRGFTISVYTDIRGLGASRARFIYAHEGDECRAFLAVSVMRLDAEETEDWVLGDLPRAAVRFPS